MSLPSAHRALFQTCLAVRTVRPLRAIGTGVRFASNNSKEAASTDKKDVRSQNTLLRYAYEVINDSKTEEDQTPTKGDLSSSSVWIEPSEKEDAVVTTQLDSTKKQPLPSIHPDQYRTALQELKERKQARLAKQIEAIDEEQVAIEELQLQRLEQLQQDGIIIPSKREEGFQKKFSKYSLDQRDAKDGLISAFDPNAVARKNWERKQVIDHVRNDWVISKEAHLKRTERQCVVKSLDIKTSRKKLGMVARQLRGKTIDEALIQMRFSKKRFAIEIAKHLEHAKNVAIVEWGMGLGKAEGKIEDPVKIKLKTGSSKEVNDRTEIYIDQAWVGRGAYHMFPDYRARGRVYWMKKPYTHMSVLLKEEATRVREHEEKEDKRLNSKLFLTTPDRAIPGQRQYVMW